VHCCNKEESTTNINSDKNNNKMLFYKANEELVRSVYETQMGEKVAEQLTKMGIECYCPLITKRQWSDRKKKVVVPLLIPMSLCK
jgi:hypothetical protein